MKILLCSDACPQTTSYYYERALRAEGHDVVTLGPLFTEGDVFEWQHAEENANQWHGDGRFRRWDMLMRLPQHRDIETEPSGKRRALSGDGGCDVLLWIDAGLQRLSLDVTAVTVPTVALVGDLHCDEQLDQQVHHAQQFDHAFLQFKPDAEPIFKHHGIDAHWLPPCADPLLDLKGIDVDPIYDVGFIGSTNPEWHGRRVRVLSKLVDAGIEVQVESAMHEEAALFNRRCRVLFNYSMTDDLNMRVPESMISGRPLVTDTLPGLGSFGKPGAHYLSFSTDDEAIDQVQWALAEQYNHVGANGRKMILERHTYRHRIREILAVL